MDGVIGKTSRRGFLRAGARAALALGLVPAVRLHEAMETDPRARVRPTPEQVEWQRSELSMFLHFGMNTFTDREWGEGTEDPRLFTPESLDATQWIQVAKECGFRYLILTAKHHDGFCLWPSRYTDHCVKSSPWKNGKGDVVREFANAVHAAKLKLGLYLSPWDRHERTYGDSPAYNRYFIAQLTELLTNYGEVAEVWFDGACGEGPNGKRQEYDWQAYYETIRRLQPKALIAICGPDIRWVGNEDGYARETEWSIQPAPAGARQPVDGWAWYPAECDVSIRPGWFWHAHENSRIKSVEHLVDIYFKSVGRNSVLLLNVPPDRRGVLHEADVTRLQEWRKELDRLFAKDVAPLARTSAARSARGQPPTAAVDGKTNTAWCPGATATEGMLELIWSRPQRIAVAMLQEHIPQGQRVEEYELHAWTSGEWRVLCRGTTIGHKKLDRFEPVTTDRVRVHIKKAIAPPLIERIALFS